MKIDNNQIGIIVLFLYPTPNKRMLPSKLYNISGLTSCMDVNTNIKIRMAVKATLF